MTDALVLYATREGQSERIARRAAERLAGHGLAVEVRDALARDEVWPEAARVLLVAPIHYGRHDRRLEGRVRARRALLEGRPGAFLSVSLAAASAEAREREDVRRRMQAFLERTGWRPAIAETCAGALRYTRYSWWKRWLMRRIAAKEGGDTDTSRDQEYTDWAQVERVADELAAAQRPAS